MEITGMLLKFQLLATYLLLMLSKVQAQQTIEKIVTETQFLLYLPEDYNKDTNSRWPLVVFLHGSGESGHDIHLVKKHGPPKLAEKGKQFPFILVSPQNPAPNGWEIDNVYRLVQNMKSTHRVDPSRIYLTGLSMGGFATWALAMKYPDEFAAIAPVCGGGDTAQAWKMRNIPVWCFHGALDDVVPPAGSENMIKAAGRWNHQIRYTRYADRNHNSWDTTYDSSDTLYNWLLSHRKFRYTEIHPDAVQLKKYTGTYTGPDNDTVRIIVDNHKLVAMPGRDIVPLHSGGNDLFFLRPDRPMDIRFQPSSKKSPGFWFLGDRKLYYRRID